MVTINTYYSKIDGTPLKIPKFSTENKVELERHSGERIPRPGWTVYVLYPTERADLDPDLNQNLIGLLLSSKQLIHQVFVITRPQMFEILCYVSFLAQSLNGEESLRKFSYPDLD